MDTLLTLGLNLVSLSLTIISTVVFIQNSYSQKMSRYFTACQILIINWIVCHIFDIFTTNLSVKIILSNIGYFSVCTIGTVFLIFALHYTNGYYQQQVIICNRYVKSVSADYFVALITFKK